MSELFRSPIADIFFVREERLLATEAELLTSDRPPEGRRRQFLRWIREGQVQIGISGVQPWETAALDGLIDLDAIPDSADCQVLCLPPYYLVQLRTSLRSVYLLTRRGRRQPVSVEPDSFSSAMTFGDPRGSSIPAAPP